VSDWGRNTPWRQGRLLTAEATKSLGLLHAQYPDDTVTIVATHDSDLAQLPTTEPDVEVIVGRRVVRLDGNFTYAKAARTLHIGFAGKSPMLAEFSATAKHKVKKLALGNWLPAPGHLLSSEDRAVFQRWLASRYHRSAFPDEFESCLKWMGLDKKIAKAVKPHGNSIVAVLFDVDEGANIVRTDASDIYILDIVLLHASEPDYEIAEKNAQSAKFEIETTFREKLYDSESESWQQIELRSVEVMSEEALSYRQFTLMRRWRLDHVSLGAGPHQPLVPE
jgi:hypothetical protein